MKTPAHSGCFFRVAFTMGYSGTTLNSSARAATARASASASPAPLPRKLSGTPV